MELGHNTSHNFSHGVNCCCHVLAEQQQILSDGSELLYFTISPWDGKRLGKSKYRYKDLTVDHQKRLIDIVMNSCFKSLYTIGYCYHYELNNQGNTHIHGLCLIGKGPAPSHGPDYNNRLNKWQQHERQRMAKHIHFYLGKPNVYHNIVAKIEVPIHIDECIEYITKEKYESPKNNIDYIKLQVLLSEKKV